MISVIKMEKGVGAVGCAGVIISRSCISLTRVGKYGNFALILLDLVLESSFGYWRVLLSLCYSCFCNLLSD
jgi:hypothetical protein